MIRVDDILATVARNHPSSNLDLIRRAYLFAAVSHRDQRRDSGEPYLTHPLEVAKMLADLKLDIATICVGLLHDVVEDTLATLSEIEQLFGPDIANLVDGVTKISQISFSSQEEKQAANFRKLLLALTSDIRVIMVKFADRMHNMRTLSHKTLEKRRQIARETLDIYAPLAHRLGFGKIRSELEDLAFQHLEPRQHAEIRSALEQKREVNDAFLGEVTEIIQGKMKEAGIPCRTESRVKRLYSIFQKLQAQRITIDQVYDLLAVRIITTDKSQCYAALGVINTTWPPVPGRIKDFIGMPRPNGYMSLHTSVVALGQPFEVQIRSEEMHRVAEDGIAAHWSYKDGKLVSMREHELVQSLRHLVDSQTDQGPEDFMKGLRMDLYTEEVQAFTPKGKVISLPKDATAVDFAYAIHSEVGQSCYGAKVNGRMVPLKTKLQNGDTVEIITQPGRTPSRDWLNFVKTTRARSRIRHFLAQKERQRSLEVGKRILEKEARKYKLNLRDILESPRLLEVAGEYGCHKPDDVISAVAYGKIAARQLLLRAAPGRVDEPAPDGRITSVVKKVLGLGGQATLRVRGLDDSLIFRAKCCSPIPGEKVVGYITRGKGVAVHSRTCKNIESLMVSPERQIDVEWAGAPSVTERFAVPIVVITEDKPGIMAAISTGISGVGANISTIEARTADNRAIINLTVEIPDMKNFERVLDSIRDIDGVHEVTRQTQSAKALKTG